MNVELSDKSIDLLRQVKRAILAQPNFYAQNRWVSSVNSCGTTCCIAGWADFVVNGKAAHNKRAKKLIVPTGQQWKVADEWLEIAAEALGITLDESERLCEGSSEWPEDLAGAYAEAATAKERAKVAAARIEHFIATDGAE